MTDSLAVGVRSWPDFARNKGFYPDDLPPEWRLGYYANEFNSVCLPLAELPADGDERIEWFDGLPAGFRLSFEAAAAGDLDRLPGADGIGDAEPAWLLLPPGVDAPPGPWRALDADEGPWRPGFQRSSPVALLPADPDPRRMRCYIEQWISGFPGNDPRDLWFDPAIDPGALSAARQMVELMGL